MNVAWNSITDCTVLLLKFHAGLNYKSLFSIIELAGLFNTYKVVTQSLEHKHPLPDFFETRSIFFFLEKRMISFRIYVEGCLSESEKNRVVANALFRVNKMQSKGPITQKILKSR